MILFFARLMRMPPYTSINGSLTFPVTFSNGNFMTASWNDRISHVCLSLCFLYNVVLLNFKHDSIIRYCETQIFYFVTDTSFFNVLWFVFCIKYIILLLALSPNHILCWLLGVSCYYSWLPLCYVINGGCHQHGIRCLCWVFVG